MPSEGQGPSRRMRGRPRSQAAQDSILLTAYRLLKAYGLQEVSTQQIAREAGVSTATLYRWWPSKEAILLDAFFAAAGKQLPFPQRGSPIERLRVHAIRGMTWLASEDGRVMLRLIQAIQDDAVLRRQFLERFYLPRRAAAREVIIQAMEVGELPPSTDPELIMDVLYGPQYFRLFLGHAPPDQAFAAAVFDLVIGPMRERRRSDR